jgi:hypothetical protein
MKPAFKLLFMTLMEVWVIFCQLSVAGQSPITTFSPSYVAASGSVNNYSQLPAAGSNSFGGCSATFYTYTFGNGTFNQLKLSGFTANAKSFIMSAGGPAVIKLRRVDNSNVTGSRSIVFLESVSSPTTTCPSSGTMDFKPPYNDVMESFLNNNTLNQGTDNIFTNAGNGDGNINNIERVDVIFPSGLKTASITDAGFAILDRGNNNNHDPFRIAAITSLDGSGNPASFGAVKTCTAGNGSINGSWGHPSLANGNKNLSVYVLRKDPSDTYLRASAAINQEMGGVFYSFADLNITANQMIYGYSLLGPDGIANPTSSQLLNINDATVYPTGTTEAAGGGLDLLTVNTVFVTGANVLLPQQIISFKGWEINGSAFIKWELSGTEEEKIIDLERSEDKLLFSSIYTNRIKGKSKMVASYVDNHVKGTYYYRLKINTSATAKIQYSPILIVAVKGKQNFRVYPTLADRFQTLKVEGLLNEHYTAILCDLKGVSANVNLYGHNNRASLRLPGNLVPGLYSLSLYNIHETVPYQINIFIR